MILDAGKDWIAKVKSAESAREAGDSMQQGMDSLLELYQTYAGGRPGVVAALVPQCTGCATGYTGGGSGGITQRRKIFHCSSHLLVHTRGEQLPIHQCEV